MISLCTLVESPGKKSNNFKSYIALVSFFVTFACEYARHYSRCCAMDSEGIVSRVESMDEIEANPTKIYFRSFNGVHRSQC